MTNFKGDIQIEDCFGQKLVFMETENCNKHEEDLLKNIISKKWLPIYMEKNDLNIEEYSLYFECINEIGGIILDVFGKENLLIHQQGNTKIIVLTKKQSKKQYKTIVERLKKVDIINHFANRVLINK